MMISSESPTTSDNNTMDQHTYNGNENYDNDMDSMKDPLGRFSFDSKGDEDDDDNENESEHGNTAMSMLMNYYGTEKIDPEQETKSPAELIKSVSFKPDAYVKELLDTKQVHELIKHDAQMLVCMFILYVYRMYIRMYIVCIHIHIIIHNEHKYTYICIHLSMYVYV